MNAMDESLMEEDHQPAKDENGKVTWPFSPEDDSREFELFLMDIGLRL